MSTVSDTLEKSRPYIHQLYLKYLSVLLLTLVIVSYLIVLATPMANNYEVSVFNSFPTSFWFLCFIIILFSASGFVLQEKKKHKCISLIALLLIYVLLVLLPYFRGYHLYGSGDLLTHIGSVETILASGGTGSNIYPFVHVLGATLTVVANKSVINTLPYLTLFWVVTLPLLLLLLSQEVSDNRQHMLWLPVIIIGLFGLRHHHFEPSRYSRFLFPLIMYIIIRTTKSMDVRFVLLSLVYIGTLPILHLVTALHMTFILLLFAFVWVYYIQKSTNSNIFELNGQIKYVVCLATILLLLIYVYNINNNRIVQFVRVQATEFLITDQDSITSGSTLSQAASYFGIADPTDLLSLAMYRYGRFALIVSLAGALVLTNRVYFTRTETIQERSIMILFLLLVPVFPLSQLISIPFYIGRMNTFTYLIAISVLGPEVYRYVKNKKLVQDYEKAAALLILLLVVFLSISALYNGPHVRSPNQQTTEMEMSGATWLTVNQNPEINIRERGVKMVRVSVACCGFEEQVGSQKAAPHFGYGISSTPSDKQYLITSRQGRVAYPKLYPDYRSFWKYTPTDFHRLSQSQRTNKVYTNSGTVIYHRF